MFRKLLVPVGDLDYLFIAVYFCCFAPYFVRTVIRAPAGLDLVTVAKAVYGSTMLLALALLFHHFDRPYNRVFTRDDHRLGYCGVTQVVIALLVHPGSSRLPCWVLECVNLCCWIIFWISSGHRHLLSL